MSTSPSWFDQEKFSHLVKKVGKKTPAQPAVSVRAASARTPQKETHRLLHPPQDPAPIEPMGATVSRKASQPIPSSVDAVIRAPADSSGESAAPAARTVSPLARRTTPLPNLKPIFEYDKPAAEASTEEQNVPATPPETEESESTDISPSEDLTAAWQSLSDLHEELAQAREERDEARMQADALRAELEEQGRTRSAGSAGADPDELAQALKERDNSRRDYAKLREQFEMLKHDPSRAHLPAPTGSDDELEQLRAELARREDEIESLKTNSLGAEDSSESLKQELNAVQAQIAQSRDEASIAQRGLALSQRALQETRDALREATEASSQMKLNLENLKNECSTLVQQNMLLQAQHDQLARELSALKAKQPSR
jgi:hypothetical protein